MLRTCLHGLEKDGPRDAERVRMVILLSAYLGQQRRGTHGLEVLAEGLGNRVSRVAILHKKWEETSPDMTGFIY